MFEFIRSYRALYLGNKQVAITPKGIVTLEDAVAWLESGKGGEGSQRF
jgi:hypothetical protein